MTRARRPGGGARAPGQREAVYGRNPVRELIAAGRRPVHEVWALAPLLGEPWLAGVPAVARTRAEIGRLAGSSDHQGVVALTDPYPYAAPREVLERPGPVVVLDGAQDPRNLGAVARVAEAAGAAGMLVPRRGGPGVTPTVAKASAGAVEHLPVGRVGSLAGLLAEARDLGRTVIGAATEGALDYRALDWPQEAVLVMGSEGTGLRPSVREACDHLVRIPMRGRVESLNISVAAGVLLYEATRALDSRK